MWLEKGGFVCVCMCVHVPTCLLTCGGQVSSPFSLFLETASHWVWSLFFQLNWLLVSVRLSFVSPLPWCGVIDMCCHSWFLCECWGAEFRSLKLVWQALLLIDLPSQTPVRILIFNTKMVLFRKHYIELDVVPSTCKIETGIELSKLAWGQLGLRK